MRFAFPTSADRTVTLLRDGHHWHAAVPAEGGWRPLGIPPPPPRAAPDSGPLPPTELLAAAAAHGCRRALVLLPAEIHLIEELALDPDLEPEEAHGALLFQVAEAAGLETEGMRATAIPADTTGLNYAPGGLLAALLPDKELKALDDCLSDHGLALAGVCPLGFALAGLPASAAPDASPASWIFPHASGVELVHPGSPPTVRHLPLPFVEGRDATTAYAERLRNRVPSAFAGPWQLAIGTGLPATLPATLATAGLAIAASTSVADLIPHLASQLQTGFGPALADGIDGLLRPAPKARDPHAAGTWMGLAILGVTALFLLGQTAWLGFQYWHYGRIRIAHERLEKERAGSLADVTAKEAHLKSLRDQVAFLQRDSAPVDPLYLQLLSTLTERLPRCTRLRDVTQCETSFLVAGLTVSENDIAELASTLQETFAPHGRRIVAGTVTRTAEGYESTFSFRVEKEPAP